MRTAVVILATALLVFHAAVAVFAQEHPHPRFASVDGPPPPTLPETVARDDAGRATGLAVRLSEPLRLDGVLEEGVYDLIRPMSGFTQSVPDAGEPSNERTEVWVFFDDRDLYVSARCWETQPDRMVANEMRRDHNNIIQNDNIAFGFDTLYDRRSGIAFQTTPLGARLDAQFAFQGSQNYDWNPLWNVKVARFEGGWSVEAVLPFKSLRYRQGREQLWGFNARRFSRWRNEVSFLNPVPAAFGLGGVYQPQMYAPLVGLEAPVSGQLLEIKPYVISTLTTDRTVTPTVDGDLSADYGLDVKYGVTRNATADFTYNTDFAQVEADDQQINLTRFSLFFPEKRDFFLENQGVFTFGGGDGDTPLLFYSRRIGLSGGSPVPIQTGGRLTGLVGGLNVGAITIRTEDEPTTGTPATNFSVLRLRRDVLRRSTVGLLATHRSSGVSQSAGNIVVGIDTRLAFYDNLLVNAYWARSVTEGRTEDDQSYRLHLNYSGDRYGVRAERLTIGSQFTPEVGFVRRGDMRKTNGQFRFSPRTKAHPVVRQFSYAADISTFENGGGVLETRQASLSFGMALHNSDKFDLSYTDSHEFLPRPFTISPGIVLPVDSYDFSTTRVSYEFGRQRAASGTVAYEHGPFYSGDRKALTVSAGRAYLPPYFSIEPTVTLNQVNLKEGAFATTLVGSRLTFTMTPMTFVSTLLQYNSSSRALSANVRLRWEYILGSELFVVFNEQRETGMSRSPSLTNRSFIVKVNRMIRR